MDFPDGQYRFFAWGTEGHQVIAALAEAKLTPFARAEVILHTPDDQEPSSNGRANRTTAPLEVVSTCYRYRPADRWLVLLRSA